MGVDPAPECWTDWVAELVTDGVRPAPSERVLRLLLQLLATQTSPCLLS